MTQSLLRILEEHQDQTRAKIFAKTIVGDEHSFDYFFAFLEAAALANLLVSTKQEEIDANRSLIVAIQNLRATIENLAFEIPKQEEPKK